MDSIYLQKVEDFVQNFLDEKATFHRLELYPELQEGLRNAGRLAAFASVLVQRCGSSVSDAPFDSEAELERSVEQFSLLKEWALLDGCWYDDPSGCLYSLGYKYYGCGGESKVYIPSDDAIDLLDVYKITTISRSFSPQRFLDKIAIHNALSPMAILRIEGFCSVRSDDGYELGVIVNQPFIKTDRELSSREISDYMCTSGFDMNQDAIIPATSFLSEFVIASDLGSKNVLKSLEGGIVIIDGDFEFNTPGMNLGGSFIYGPDELL